MGHDYHLPPAKAARLRSGSVVQQAVPARLAGLHAAKKWLRDSRLLTSLPCYASRVTRPVTNSELRHPIQLPVHGRIAHDGLHVLTGFGERDGLHEFRRILKVTVGNPVLH